MLFVLRDNKTVQFDDPVSKYLKNFSIKNPYVRTNLKFLNPFFNFKFKKTNKEISLRELASHTSGLPVIYLFNFFFQKLTFFFFFKREKFLVLGKS